MAEWRLLADGDQCNSRMTTPGQLGNCGTICMGIQGNGKPQGFNKTPAGLNPTLDTFAGYIVDNFGTSKSLSYQRSWHKRSSAF